MSEPETLIYRDELTPIRYQSVVSFMTGSR
jgi:hypothetical protein